MTNDELLACALERRGLTEEDLLNQNLFDGQIFMGAGHPTDPKLNFSAQDVALLHAKIDKLLELTSGLQQHPRPGTDDDFEGWESEVIKGNWQARIAADDVLRALVGQLTP